MTQCDLVVTGASGFVGPHLVACAREAGLGVGVVDWDLRDAATTTERFRALKPRAVAHLAASARDAAPWSVLEDDLSMLRSLLGALSNASDQPVLLVAGSAAQYGMGLPRPLTEEDATEPVSTYGAVKCVLERAATAPGLDCGVRVIWARAFNHVGPGQASDAPAASWARQLAEAELSGAGVLRTGALDVVRDFLDVRDVASAYVALLRSDAHGSVNVCSGTATPLSAVADALVARTRCAVERAEDPALLRSADPPHVVGDPSRLSRITGWTPRIELDESLGDLLDDWRQRVAKTGSVGATSGAIQ